jgi:hypothetical protein
MEKPMSTATLRIDLRGIPYRTAVRITDILLGIERGLAIEGLPGQLRDGPIWTLVGDPASLGLARGSLLVWAPRARANTGSPLPDNWVGEVLVMP